MDTAKARQLLDQIASNTSALRSMLDEAPTPGNIIRVKLGDNLQQALDSAKGGDTIRVQPGAYKGNFVLNPRPDAGVVTLRPDVDDGNLTVPTGCWIDKSYAPALVRLESADGLTESLRTTHGAHDYIFLGLDFPPLNPSRTQVSLGSTLGEGQITLGQMPKGFVFDRCYFHGDPTPGKGQHRGIGANCGGLIVRGCFFGDFFEVGRDSQAVCGWNGAGPVLIENSFLEASGENVLFGGGGPGIPNLVPTDIIIRHCRLTKNPVWKTHPTVPAVKNLFEIKNAAKVIVEYCYFENNWLAGQSGHAVLLKAANTDGFDVWSTCTDVLVQFNLFRKIGALLNINNSEGQGPTQGTHRVTVRHNLAYDINETMAGDARPILIGGGPEAVVIDHNTVLSGPGAKTNSFLTAYDKGQTIKSGKFTNNIVREGEYGIFGGGSAALGPVAFRDYFPDGIFKGNAIEQGGFRAIDYGPDNTRVGTGQLASLLDANKVPVSSSALGRVITTDGLTVGADVPQILSHTKDLP